MSRWRRDEPGWVGGPESRRHSGIRGRMGCGSCGHIWKVVTFPHQPINKVYRITEGLLVGAGSEDELPQVPRSRARPRCACGARASPLI